MDKIVVFQFSRLRKSISFWFKYIFPFFLIIITLSSTILFVQTINKFYGNIDLIISYLKIPALEIDFFHTIKLIFISNIKIVLFDLVGLLLTAFLGWISYFLIGILLEYLYNKNINENQSYQLIRQISLPIMYSKTQTWSLVFIVVTLTIFIITIFLNFGKIINDGQSINIKFLLTLYYIFLLAVIPFIYCFFWYLYNRFVKSSIGDNNFRILYFSKPSVARRLQNFIGAFVGAWIISQIFILYFYEVRRFDDRIVNNITSDQHYINFWERLQNEGYDEKVFQAFLNVGDSPEKSPQISFFQELYSEKDLAKDFVRVLYNIIIVAFAFEIIFPYLIMFTMMKIKRIEIKNLIKTASIPILATILFQILNEGLYFGIKLDQVINFKTSAIYIISFAIAILSRKDILQIDPSDPNEDSFPQQE